MSRCGLAHTSGERKASTRAPALASRRRFPLSALARSNEPRACGHRDSASPLPMSGASARVHGRAMDGSHRGLVHVPTPAARFTPSAGSPSVDDRPADPRTARSELAGAAVRTNPVARADALAGAASSARSPPTRAASWTSSSRASPRAIGTTESEARRLVFVPPPANGPIRIRRTERGQTRTLGEARGGLERGQPARSSEWRESGLELDSAVELLEG